MSDAAGQPASLRAEQVAQTRGALIAELQSPNAGTVPDAALLSSGAANRIAFEFNAARQAQRRLRSYMERLIHLLSLNIRSTLRAYLLEIKSPDHQH